MTDPRSEVEVIREALSYPQAWLYPNAEPTVFAERKDALAALASLEARLNEAREALRQTEAWLSEPGRDCPNQGLHRTVVIALASITDPKGGDPLVGPVVCYACPMFEGAAHMPNAANHRTDPEGGDK